MMIGVYSQRKKMGKYEKYVYWLEGAKFESLRLSLAKEEISMHETKKAVCVPLAKRVEIGYVPPNAWEKYELCKRQMSWYRTSHHFGRFLVVSSRELNKYGLSHETIIQDTKFRPGLLPGKKEKLTLIKQGSYQKYKPSKWENIGGEDEEVHDRWLKIMGVRGITYEELFITHCANHANFIEPLYCVHENDSVVPFSIDKTSHICSACLEFFNIVGHQFHKKYVVPCPGAVLFAGMAPNRYFEVTGP